MARHKLHKKMPVLKKLLTKSFGEIYFKSLSYGDLRTISTNFQIDRMYAKGNQIVVKLQGSN